MEESNFKTLSSKVGMGAVRFQVSGDGFECFGIISMNNAKGKR